MTRPYRFFLEGVPVHIVQRGVDRAYFSKKASTARERTFASFF